MACAEEHRKRNTYENVRRLADVCNRITGERYVIYKDAGGAFGYCPEDYYTPGKGIRIETVPQH